MVISPQNTPVEGLFGFIPIDGGSILPAGDADFASIITQLLGGDAVPANSENTEIMVSNDTITVAKAGLSDIKSSAVTSDNEASNSIQARLIIHTPDGKEISIPITLTGSMQGESGELAVTGNNDEKPVITISHVEPDSDSMVTPFAVLTPADVSEKYSELPSLPEKNTHDVMLKKENMAVLEESNASDDILVPETAHHVKREVSVTGISGEPETGKDVAKTDYSYPYINKMLQENERPELPDTIPPQERNRYRNIHLMPEADSVGSSYVKNEKTAPDNMPEILPYRIQSTHSEYSIIREISNGTESSGPVDAMIRVINASEEINPETAESVPSLTSVTAEYIHDGSEIVQAPQKTGATSVIMVQTDGGKVQVAMSISDLSLNDNPVITMLEELLASGAQVEIVLDTVAEGEEASVHILKEPTGSETSGTNGSESVDKFSEIKQTETDLSGNNQKSSLHSNIADSGILHNNEKSSVTGNDNQPADIQANNYTEEYSTIKYTTDFADETHISEKIIFSQSGLKWSSGGVGTVSNPADEPRTFTRTPVNPPGTINNVGEQEAAQQADYVEYTGSHGDIESEVGTVSNPADELRTFTRTPVNPPGTINNLGEQETAKQADYVEYTNKPSGPHGDIESEEGLPFKFINEPEAAGHDVHIESAGRQVRPYRQNYSGSETPYVTTKTVGGTIETQETQETQETRRVETESSTKGSHESNSVSGLENRERADGITVRTERTVHSDMNDVLLVKQTVEDTVNHRDTAETHRQSAYETTVHKTNSGWVNGTETGTGDDSSGYLYPNDTTKSEGVRPDSVTAVEDGNVFESETVTVNRNIIVEDEHSAKSKTPEKGAGKFVTESTNLEGSTRTETAAEKVQLKEIHGQKVLQTRQGINGETFDSKGSLIHEESGDTNGTAKIAGKATSSTLETIVNNQAVENTVNHGDTANTHQPSTHETTVHKSISGSANVSRTKTAAEKVQPKEIHGQKVLQAQQGIEKETFDSRGSLIHEESGNTHETVKISGEVSLSSAEVNVNKSDKSTIPPGLKIEQVKSSGAETTVNSTEKKAVFSPESEFISGKPEIVLAKHTVEPAEISESADTVRSESTSSNSKGSNVTGHVESRTHTKYPAIHDVSTPNNLSDKPDVQTNSATGIDSAREDVSLLSEKQGHTAGSENFITSNTSNQNSEAETVEHIPAPVFEKGVHHDPDLKPDKVSAEGNSNKVAPVVDKTGGAFIQSDGDSALNSEGGQSEYQSGNFETIHFDDDVVYGGRELAAQTDESQSPEKTDKSSGITPSAGIQNESVLNKDNVPGQFRNSSEYMTPGETENRLMNTIVRNARFMITGGQSSAEIKLEPPNLGKMKIEIVTENSKITGKITVESHEVKEMIQNSISSLKERLSESGLKVESFDVQVGHNSGTDSWAQREHAENLKMNFQRNMTGYENESGEKTPATDETKYGRSLDSDYLDVLI